MNATHTIHRTRDLSASAQAIWDRISNHAETHTWVLPARVRILIEGEPPPNGVGAVREVSFPKQRLWSTIKERVMSFQPPSSFSYAIIAGMPGLRDHLGTLTVEPLAANLSRLTWHIDFEFSRWHPMGWIAGPFTRTFGRVIDDALDELARQMAGPRS